MHFEQIKNLKPGEIVFDRGSRFTIKRIEINRKPARMTLSTPMMCATARIIQMSISVSRSGQLESD
jgi:hypothetical protein